MDFDVLIIGGGPAGYVAAIRASQLNMKVGLVEKDDLGGICLNWGCIPTKAMLHAAETYHTVQNAAQVGVFADNIRFDIKKIVDFARNDVIKKLQGGIDYLMKKNKVEIIKGEAHFIDKNTIEIKETKQKLTAKHFIIATGSSPRELPNLKFDGKNIWNYRHAMTPEKMPKSILVVGSGAIGMEFASFYHTLGTEIHVAEMLPRILPQEDEEISTMAEKIFTKKGIKIHTDAKIENVKINENYIDISIATNKKKIDLQVEKIIVAAGVTPNIQNMNLEKIGIKIDKFITINENFQTNIPHIFAIGDVAGAPCLAHKASFDAVRCIEYIKNKKNKPYPEIPGCTYCIPQIASIGLTEKQAKEKYKKIKIGRSHFASNGRAIAGCHTEGMVKNIFDAETGELLGAHIIGHEATELIHSYVVGITGELTDLDYKNMIFAHPTMSEVIHEAVLDADDESIH